MEATLITHPQLQLKAKTSKGLLWFGIVSIVMLFAGLTSAYLVRQGDGKWVQFDLPKIFAVSTILILLGSLTIQLAVRSAKRNEMNVVKLLVVLTAVLGFGFMYFQYRAWSELYSNGIAFISNIGDIKTHYTYLSANGEHASQAQNIANVAGSFLYTLTGLHVAHLIGGMIAVFFVMVKTFLKKYSAVNYTGISLCAIYWHFLGGLWVYLYLFLLYIR